MTQVRILGHRGASASFGENTLAAFLGARDMGATGSELDVRLSADDVVVVHHDAELADGRLIRSLPAADLPDWLPTLAEVFSAVPSQFINVELKNKPGEPDHDPANALSRLTVDVIHACGASGRVIISSFNPDAVAAVTAADPGLAVGSLFSLGPIAVTPAMVEAFDAGYWISDAVAKGIAAIHPDNRLLSVDLLAAASAAGLEVNVWTVDDPDRMIELAQMGVTSIITNKPDLAVKTLAG